MSQGLSIKVIQPHINGSMHGRSDKVSPVLLIYSELHARSAAALKLGQIKCSESQIGLCEVGRGRVLIQPAI